MDKSRHNWGSSIHYLTIIAIGLVLERFASHILDGLPIVFGQPVSVIAAFITMSISGVFWLRLQTTRNAPLMLLCFLLAMGGAWILHLLLYRWHGDAFTYAAFLYPVPLLMVALKPPTLQQAKQAVLALAWSISLVLVATRLLEVAGVLSLPTQSAGVVNFDETSYFLPVNTFLNIEGRWPGPFGHNGDTAMMGALLIVIAASFWSRASWFFLTIGTTTLIVTNGRASIGAAIVGLVVLYMFSTHPKLARIPRAWRITSGVALIALGAIIMVSMPAGLTGRNTIWPAFLNVWWESPWIGVGASGFADANETVQTFGHAHSLYIEELARSGVAGLLSQFVALGIGVLIAARAANFGYPGPLAVMATYFVTGVTEPRNNWIELAAASFPLLLVVVAASAITQDHQSRMERTQSQDAPTL